jgi:hypothetical protein
MKFLHLFNKSSAAGFAKIQGYEDIKDIVRRDLDSNENYNLLPTSLLKDLIPTRHSRDEKRRVF